MSLKLSFIMPFLEEHSTFIEALKYCVDVCRDLESITSRKLFPVLAVTTNNQDPESKRRIKVIDPLLGGNLESGWIEPIKVTANSDLPLPQVYQTVLVFFADGHPEKGYYLNLINDPNPSRQKEDPVLDESYFIEGNRELKVSKNETIEIGGDSNITVKGTLNQTVEKESQLNILGDSNLTVAGQASDRYEESLTIEAGQSILLKTDSGAFISLSATGYVTIEDAFGRRITLGGVSGFGEWNLNSLPLRISNAVSFQINGKEVATIGATVDEGTDTVVTRGW